MIFSLAAAFLLFPLFIQTEGFSVEEMDDPGFDTARGKSLEKFKVHIKEKGKKFQEKIYINKEKDMEYFNGPAHNGNDDTDNLYDFRMNITISRMKKARVCHLYPLPEDIPRPKVLSKGLKLYKHTSPIIRKISMQWVVGARVDKNTLRKEVREFCGQFPVYRLVPFSKDSFSVEKSGRVKRDVVTDRPLCKPRRPGNCRTSEWLYRCVIATQSCVYYLTCKEIVSGKDQNLDCNGTPIHKYNSVLCCIPRCP